MISRHRPSHVSSAGYSNHTMPREEQHTHARMERHIIGCNKLLLHLGPVPVDASCKFETKFMVPLRC